MKTEGRKNTGAARSGVRSAVTGHANRAKAGGGSLSGGQRAAASGSLPADKKVKAAPSMLATKLSGIRGQAK
jgi:hypothetical protein